jgi:hypothetical protein
MRIENLRENSKNLFTFWQDCFRSYVFAGDITAAKHALDLVKRICIGDIGMYISCGSEDEAEAEKLLTLAVGYRQHE